LANIDIVHGMRIGGGARQVIDQRGYVHGDIDSKQIMSRKRNYW